MSTSRSKVMLDPSVFLVGAFQGKNLEDEKNASIACNPELFERLEDLAVNYEVFISQSFMNMFLKIADEIKLIKGKPGFLAPIYVLMKLFGLELLRKKSEAEDTVNRYINVFNSQNPNAQAFLDIADKMRFAFKNKKIKQYAFRTNIGRGYHSVGHALLKKLDALCVPASKIEGVKDNEECTPEKIEKIYEDMLDFVEFEGSIIADKKQSFDLLASSGLPASTEKKPNPDLIERDRSFLKDKFKGVRSRGFRFMMSKLNSGKFILIDVKDYI